MDRKKIIIISIGIAVALILGLGIIIVITLSSGKKSETSQETSQESAQSSSSTQPVFPGEIDVPDSIVSNTYQNATAEAQKRAETYSEFALLDESNNVISVGNLARNYNTSLAPIANYLWPDNYKVFFCTLPSGESSRGLKLETSLKLPPDGIYRIDDTLKDWRQNIIIDLKGFFFPEVDLGINPSIKYGESNYTTASGGNYVDTYYANVRDTKNGHNLSLDYALMNGTIFIADSPECLHNVLDHYQDEGTPF